MAKVRRKQSECPNCHTLLMSNYEFCPSCGQENHHYHVPVRHVAYEFVESITHFDTKLWNVIKTIFTKPGKLTKDFLSGKRARYVPPARLYVFVSVIALFLINWAANNNIDIEVNGGQVRDSKQISAIWLKDSKIYSEDKYKQLEKLVEGNKNLDELFKESLWLSKDSLIRGQQINIIFSNPDSFKNYLAPIQRRKTQPNIESIKTLLAQVNKDSLKNYYPSEFYVNVLNKKFEFKNKQEEQAFLTRLEKMSTKEIGIFLDSIQQPNNFFTRNTVKRFKKILSLNSDSDPDNTNRKLLVSSILKNGSFVMFFLMPLAALLLFIVSRKRFYYEHLIFSVHAHTLTFIFAIITVLLNTYLPSDLAETINAIFTLVFMVYFIISIKTVYGKTWLASILYAILVGVLYLIIFVFFTLIAFAISIWFL
jgi:hypothetical protein